MPPAFRRTSDVRTSLERLFPNLKSTRWLLKSPWNDTYKCISWAACRTDIIWWPPGGTSQIYWPPGVPLDESIETFIRAFETIGYRPCENSDFEFGYQKIAIYASNDRQVKHMARQHLLGRGWLSKLGSLEDIAHADLKCIEGDPAPIAAALYGSYGKVRQILKRTWWDTLINLCLFRCLWAAFKFWLYRLVHPTWIWNNIVRSYEKATPRNT